MATATYQRTVDAGQEPDRKALSVVDVDGQPVEVAWWPSLLEQWGKEGVRAYVEAEALWATGNYTDARNIMTAVGAEWANQWVAEHPDPTPVQPVVDPLAL